MRIAYFGSGAFGIPTLSRLAQKHEIVCVVTQPDRPAGRGGRLTPTPVAAWAAGNLPGARIVKPEKIREPAVIQELRGLAGPGKADAWVVIAFGQKLPAGLLEGVFAINLHASLLPRWRGAAPINAAILAGDAQTGNSVITLADRMDAGLILGQSRRAIEPEMTAGELHDLLAADGGPLVEQVLEEYARGTLLPRPQDESQVTLASKLSRESGAISFSQPADLCRRQIHAMTPWPGVTVSLHGKPVKLLRAKVAAVGTEQPMEGLSPGGVMDPAAGIIACGGGTWLQVLEVQPAGGRPMSWAEFARGRRMQHGDRLVAGGE